MALEPLEVILSRMKQYAHQAGTHILADDLYQCKKCKDREFVDRGDGVFVECECRKQKLIERRLKSSMVGSTFANVTLEQFIPRNDTAYKMLVTVKNYIENFQNIRHRRSNGIGFMAILGESTINTERNPERRAALKAKHNSYGLGKTHLQSAMVVDLIRRGIQAVMVNDTDIVAELRNGQFTDETDYFERKIQTLESVELLVWDDLGKAKTTEWVLNQYYRIFNFRYRAGKPTCFSTNEDMDSLAERIGDATASRLFNMCKDDLIRCEGPDYRLQ